MIGTPVMKEITDIQWFKSLLENLCLIFVENYKSFCVPNAFPTWIKFGLVKGVSNISISSSSCRSSSNKWADCRISSSVVGVPFVVKLESIPATSGMIIFSGSSSELLRHYSVRSSCKALKRSEAYLEPSRTSTMKLFCKNS